MYGAEDKVCNTRWAMRAHMQCRIRQTRDADSTTTTTALSSTPWNMSCSRAEFFSRGAAGARVGRRGAGTRPRGRSPSVPRRRRKPGPLLGPTRPARPSVPVGSWSPGGCSAARCVSPPKPSPAGWWCPSHRISFSESSGSLGSPQREEATPPAARDKVRN